VRTPPLRVWWSSTYSTSLRCRQARSHRIRMRYSSTAGLVRPAGWDAEAASTGGTSVAVETATICVTNFTASQPLRMMSTRPGVGRKYPVRHDEQCDFFEEWAVRRVLQPCAAPRSAARPVVRRLACSPSAFCWTSSCLSLAKTRSARDALVFPFARTKSCVGSGPAGSSALVVRPGLGHGASCHDLQPSCDREARRVGV
jgi:hypothetical protein